MDEAGVDRAIVAHPEPYQDDHRYLEHCLEVGQGRLLGTCLFFADRPGSVDALKALVDRTDGRIVAARIHAYAPERLPAFGSAALRTFWKAVGALGLAMQIHLEPRYARGFEPLIRDFPETTVVIDHLGRPFQGSPEEYAVVRNWSKLPNTVMKLSLLPAPWEYPHRDIAPVIRDLIARFGPDRLLYGGGFGPGVTGAAYRAHRERVRSYLVDLPAADQANILGGSAARIFARNGQSFEGRGLMTDDQ